ncbi:MAG: hypothetical protein UW06_C0045G0004 [Parcubacteria group bacterium GW2011_GWE1_43_8]|uniref:Type II toxin-antitoxin system HicA family toxin n=1 Tax=Candidatus Veblenbacteria bacterium RIFOXYB1_FULL_43_13 TaxID=1802426 RepID=A0A1G2Q508_9BACT|nr:MAG: hypothetical protein UW06_C0045G0004 [Parcubacteria group bacterium GW2011_GWE1_43_8]OHA54912.1 MAG: hypothetical protein A2388_00605 [Candidatus Veblenbacteria bacterium RIFOXYB1_FULL_43_13]
MSSHNEIPDGITRDRFLRALKRLGWNISKIGGKGSHYMATWPRTKKSITIQYDFRKDVLRRIIKAMTTISGQTWDDVRHKY